MLNAVKNSGISFLASIFDLSNPNMKILPVTNWFNFFCYINMIWFSLMDQYDMVQSL